MTVDSTPGGPAPSDPTLVDAAPRSPPEQTIVDAFLFDMDGTLIQSTDVVNQHWARVANELGVPAEKLAETLLKLHGARSIDILRVLCPEKATPEFAAEMDGRVPVLYRELARAVPGAGLLLDRLTAESAPWGIVTSGSLPLVTGWLDVLGLRRPATLVTAEDVERGKPDPGPYLLGRERLGASAAVTAPATRVLVAEDSPNGVRAAKGAGCAVVAVLGSASPEELREAGADWVVEDLSRVRLAGVRDGEEDAREYIVELSVI